MFVPYPHYNVYQRYWNIEHTHTSNSLTPTPMKKKTIFCWAKRVHIFSSNFRISNVWFWNEFINFDAKIIFDDWKWREFLIFKIMSSILKNKNVVLLLLHSGNKIKYHIIFFSTYSSSTHRCVVLYYICYVCMLLFFFFFLLLFTLWM